MMLSPGFAAEEHKNDTFEQLITERDSCFLELKELEKVVFDEEKNQVMDVNEPKAKPGNPLDMVMGLFKW